jgi:hypothetical protein
MSDVRVVNCYDRAVPVDGKTAVSVRDGVIEYLGAELGIDPPDRMFTVYRSPATIANAAGKMIGIPLTAGHVDVDFQVANASGMVESAEMIDLFQDEYGSTVGIKNKVKINDGIDVAGYELSLGYAAELLSHNKYDFEQRNIQPHHLAYVEAGRCGTECRFFDAKPGAENMSKKTDKPVVHKAFADESGAVNLDQIIEIAMALPEAMKKAPLEKLQEIIPMLQELIAMSKEAGIDVVEPVASEDEKPEGEEMQAADMDAEEEKKEENFTDSKKFQDAVTAAVARHIDVVTKAQQFLDEAYVFTGKPIKQIMSDALATQHKETFADEELATAFKLLKKNTDYAKFGDAGVSPILQLKDKEL